MAQYQNNPELALAAAAEPGPMEQGELPSARCHVE